MAYRSAKKRQDYARKWRRKNPTYMRDYYRECIKPLGGANVPAGKKTP